MTTPTDTAMVTAGDAATRPGWDAAAPHYKRGMQPRCVRVLEGTGKPCNHATSLHGGADGGPCKAMGCRCPGLVLAED